MTVDDMTVDQMIDESRSHVPGCASWCNDHERGHPRLMGTSCMSESERLMLPLGRPIEADPEFDEDPTDFIDTYLWKSDGQGVTVNVSHHDEECLVMSLDDARQLITRLSVLVGQVESEPVPNL